MRVAYEVHRCQKLKSTTTDSHTRGIAPLLGYDTIDSIFQGFIDEIRSTVSDSSILTYDYTADSKLETHLGTM